MRFLPVNDTAILVELADLDQTLALLQSLQATPIPGVREMIPAARTILIEFAPRRIPVRALVGQIAKRDLARRAARADVVVEIPVAYNGEDLADVADMLQIGVQEVVERHTACEWSVAFTGFAPGFAYLSGGDPVFDIPRRTTPRTKVPAGSVALAGKFSAVYPKDSPGGWQLIGVTQTPMWDLSREVPALLQPGYRVRFVDARASAAVSLPAGAAKAAQARPASQDDALPGQGALRVRATGLLTVFQDLGRPGQAAQGVSASGAMDRKALKNANRLVGNASDCPALETVGGLALQSVGDTVIAVTGADAPLTLACADGRSWPVPRLQALALADGDTLRVGQPRRGARCYVAMRGGFQVTPVLGSASTDILAQIGPPALQAGQLLPVHAVGGAIVGHPESEQDALPEPGGDVVLDLELGPRTDWFTARALQSLVQQRWQVTPQSNRVGLRLAGEKPLERAIADELPSEGTALGALQVPASGQPVLFLADHPLTGGYPVIGCVAPHHLDLAGQIPVGAWIRFKPIRAFEELSPNHDKDGSA